MSNKQMNEQNELANLRHDLKRVRALLAKIDSELRKHPEIIYQDLVHDIRQENRISEKYDLYPESRVRGRDRYLDE